VKEAQHIEDDTGEFMPSLFIDAEHSLDVDYAEALGIDLSRVAIAQPGYGEEALNAAETAIREGYRLVVVDSVAALTPKAEVEGEMGEAHVGLHARLMSQACRKLGPLVKKQGALLIFINQVRMKVGIVFGNSETRPGGKALDYWASYLIEIRAPRSGKQTGKTLMGYGEVEESVELATKVAVSVRKNKVFPPHRKAEFVIDYGRGINRAKDVVTFLEWVGVFKGSAKSKGDRLRIPSKAKMYTPSGLLKIMDEPEVQSDVIEIIKNLEERHDTHS
jgi:recombination protein RecA